MTSGANLNVLPISNNILEEKGHNPLGRIVRLNLSTEN